MAKPKHEQGNKPAGQPTQNDVVKDMVELYKQQLDKYLTDDIMLPMSDYAEELNKELSKLAKKESERTKSYLDLTILTSEYSIVRQKKMALEGNLPGAKGILKDTKAKYVAAFERAITEDVSTMYTEAAKAEQPVDMRRIAVSATHFARNASALLAKEMSNKLDSIDKNNPVIGKYRNKKILNACNAVFKGYCTLLYTVFDLKSALGFGSQGKDNIVQRLKDNFNNVNLALTTSQQKIQESVKALNHGSSRTATMFKKEVAKVVAESKKHLDSSHRP